MPGAVPTGLGSGSAPLGKRAWTRLRSLITRLRRANMAAIAAKRIRIFDQRHAGALGECFAGQVILRGPKAAGHHDQVCPVAGVPEGRQMVVQHVAQRRVERDRDPERRQLLAEPMAVGVERLAADKLAADRDDFGPHRWFPISPSRAACPV